MPDIRYFGIRHHGPGCARSLRTALQDWQPDCVLIESPPEGEAVLAHASSPAMQPPVALLCHRPDAPADAVFHPYASYSPEWQAIQWAQAAGAALHFIDLPQTHQLALRAEARAAAEAAAAADDVDADQAGAAEDDATDQQQAAATGPAAAVTAAPSETDSGADADDSADTCACTGEVCADSEDDDNDGPDPRDPLGWLAHAAGFADGESWWNHLVEERQHDGQLFEAIAEAMTALREDAAPEKDPEEARREALREAWMRRCVREAEKEGHARIAVVCGAWHVPALQAKIKQKDDNALLKGLPKVKVSSTWVPWSYRLLGRDSGYGAGVAAPGWYQHLWDQQQGTARGSGWMARVARLLREAGMDCSSAHLIEAVRLSDTLAALRGRPAPGLEELDDAIRSVMCMGDDAPLRLIRDALQVGDRLGSVPADVPTVPLQQDLEAQQRSLRLKPEALERSLDLDLRKEGDLARSHLLHRLNLLDIPWGRASRGQKNSKGTFHEVWLLRWQPEFAVDIIEASRWGHRVEDAATARALDQAKEAPTLADLARLVDRVLLANLPAAVPGVSAAFEARAATTGDTAQLLEALPPLAQVYRYGNVRATDGVQVAHILDQLILRAALGLPLACCALAEDAARALREQILAAHQAVRLRDGEEQNAAWAAALRRLLRVDQASPLLRGLACRLLLDGEDIDAEEAARQLGMNLSRGADPLDAAAWLDGFLNRNALVLLHDEALWALVDGWLCGLKAEQFMASLALIRRCFADFTPPERQQLAQRAKAGARPAAAVSATPAWHPQRAARVLPLFHQLMGLAEVAADA